MRSEELPVWGRREKGGGGREVLKSKLAGAQVGRVRLRDLFGLGARVRRWELLFRVGARVEYMSKVWCFKTLICLVWFIVRI